MTIVAKLGSSIVSADDGALRADVLDSVCAQVGELHDGGEEVVLVTSGAISRGMEVMGMKARPRAIDELQAASAVGQGRLFRAYEERLAGRDVHAAQVLLSAADLQRRTHYLNARQTLRRLLAWHAVPVDQRERHHRHRRDHLRRQRLPRRPGGDHDRGAAAGAADQHGRAAHRRSAQGLRTPS